MKEINMALKLMNTLFGIEVLNTAPTCRVFGCDNPADNAGNGQWHIRCSMHHKALYQNKNGHNSYKGHKKDYCENIDGDEVMTLMLVRSKIEVDNAFYKSQILGWNVVPNDYMTDFEQNQIQYDGSVTFPVRVISATDL